MILRSTIQKKGNGEIDKRNDVNYSIGIAIENDIIDTI